MGIRDRRCGYCHNPDAQPLTGGQAYTPQALFALASRYRSYFGREGGVTLSGGEPLLQAPFAQAFFALCREGGIHTALDTSGCRLDEPVRGLLDETDLVLLDIKFTIEADYQRYAGCSLAAPLRFLDVYKRQGQIGAQLKLHDIPKIAHSPSSVYCTKMSLSVGSVSYTHLPFIPRYAA